MVGGGGGGRKLWSDVFNGYKDSMADVNFANASYQGQIKVKHDLELWKERRCSHVPLQGAS